MTPKQHTVLLSFGSKVLNHYVSTAGLLVIETKYGTNNYCRTFIGERGGFRGRVVYRHYDFEDKVPYDKLFEEGH